MPGGTVNCAAVPRTIGLVGASGLRCAKDWSTRSGRVESGGVGSAHPLVCTERFILRRMASAISSALVLGQEVFRGAG